MEINWTHSTRWFYHVLLLILKLVLSLMLWTDIPLLLSKDPMKRAGTCLNFENDSVMLRENFIEMNITTFLLPNLYRTNVRSNTYFLLKKSLKIWQKKLELQQSYRQFSHPSSKKLCDLIKNAGVTDPEFIKILQTLQVPVKYAFVTKRLNLNLSLDLH